MKSLDLVYDAKELREIIINNPDLPLVVFACENVYSDDYTSVLCTDVRAHIGEILDCDQQVNEEKIYCDRTDFEDDLRIHLEDEFNGDDKEFDEFVGKKLSEYEPFWKKAIIIYADN
ncbi:hypothetical protein [uncultured Dubosiella sp.]|uniref:hypothetical protein n=1 Tax=uncultured Dubosiella sp. TaxID=1937011 RepID=UPI0026285BAA|nr:hypothetical protein [uncultured Dubosiella sp.]